MNKIKLLFYNIIILTLISQSNFKYEDFLDNEFDKFFPVKSQEDYITEEEIKELLEINDDLLFLDKMLIISSKKYFPLEIFGDSNIRRKYTLNKIRIKLEKSKKTNIGQYIKIYTEINKKANYEYISNFLLGDFERFYKFLISNYKKIEKETIILFIESLPDVKKCFIGEYKNLKNFKIQIDFEAYFNLYNNINKKNYRFLLRKTELFNFGELDVKNDFINEIYYYYKLLDLKDKLFFNESMSPSYN